MAILEKVLWRLLFGPVGRLVPFRACRLLARPIARIAWMLGLRRGVTLTNLLLAFPGMNQTERRRLALRVYHSLCTVFLELLTLRHLPEEQWRRFFLFENEELLHTVGDRGALLLSGHTGNWEMLAIAAGMRTPKQISVIVKQQRDYGTLERIRTSHGNRLIPTGSAAREAVSVLAAGGLVAMLADQSAGPDEPVVPMFGIPTHTFSIPARLALRFRPRIIVGFAVSGPDGTYTARLAEILYDDLPDTPEAAVSLTQRFMNLLEDNIREHPEGWLWTHRKWKHTPGIRYEKRTAGGTDA